MIRRVSRNLVPALLLAAGGCSGEPAASRSPQADEAAQADEPGQAMEITCSYPVRPGESAQSLLDRFGEDARRETFENEGGLYEAIVLWPDDPAKTLDVTFRDERLDSAVSVRIAGKDSAWSIAGLRHGSRLDELRRLNGGPYEFYGFEWDYGGMVFDWKGGALGELAKDCSVGAMVGDIFEIEEQVPDELVGDGAVSSDLPALEAFDIKVFDLWINLPEG